MNWQIDFKKSKLINQYWESDLTKLSCPLIDIHVVNSSRLHQEGSLVFRVKINKFTEDQRNTLFIIGETLKSNKSPFLLEVFNTFIQNICGVDYYIIQTKIPYYKTVSKYHTDNNCMLEEYFSELKDLIGCYEFALGLNFPLSVYINDISVALVKNRSSPFPQICLTPYSFLISFINQINNVPVHLHFSFYEIFTIFDSSLSPLFNVESCYPEVNQLLSQDKNAIEAINTSQILSYIRNILNVPSFDINSFESITRCGEGNYGSVLLMKKNDGTLFAMKESKKKDIDILYKESFVLNSMNHRNIVHCCGYCESNVSFGSKQDDKIYPHGFMLMEYCEHGDLERTVTNYLSEGNRLSIGEIQIIFGQIALACFYVHFDKRYVHRDLKLANILVKTFDPFVQIKLCDFGFARSSDVEMKTVLGTPLCMLPCILKNESYDDRSDLFSLGCILYYLLYGKYPCGDCRNSDEILAKVKDKNIVFEEQHVHNQHFNEIVDLIQHLMNLHDMNMTWEQFRQHPFIVKSLILVENKYKSLSTN